MAHPSPHHRRGSPGGVAVSGQQKTVTTYKINPLTDQRWQEFVADHPRASVFHSTPWLSALARTYRYQPLAFTTSPPDNKLENGLVFCRVQSWITGDRLVSLPFSDHCAPLVEDFGDLQPLVAAAQM